jgi:hypothetical protein
LLDGGGDLLGVGLLGVGLLAVGLIEFGSSQTDRANRQDRQSQIFAAQSRKRFPSIERFSLGVASMSPATSDGDDPTAAGLPGVVVEEPVPRVPASPVRGFFDPWGDRARPRRTRSRTPGLALG